MRKNFEGLCVIEAILNTIKDVKGYKKYTKEKIIEEMENIGIGVKKGITENDLKKWIVKY